MADTLVGLLGIVVILGIAIALSTNRRAINLRIVVAAFALQVVVASVVIYSDIGKAALEKMSFGVLKVMDYSQVGIQFVQDAHRLSPT